MQTDYDDYDDENPSMRWMSIVVLLLAVAGFFSLAWYAYYTGTKSVQTGDIVIIEADKTPLKDQPEERGGMEFPHQEKTIYNAVAPKADSKETVVIDESEEVVIPDDMPESGMEETDEKIAAILKNAANSEQAAKTAPESARKAIEPQPKKVEAQPAEAVKPAAVTPAPKEEPVVVAPPKPTPAPAVAPKPVAAATSGTGNHQIQLGAFRSLAEAENNWTAASNKHSSVLAGRSHNVIRADLGAKGVYYRLRVAGFSAQSAKAACAALTAQKQGCFTVNP